MLNQITEERKFLSQFAYNLQSETHTGWAVDKLEQGIAATDAWLTEAKKVKPPINYPASSMWPNFLEGVESILTTKRNALDGYNNEAKTSDKHSNAFYLDVINYLNGVLISDYNTYVDFAKRDGYIGVKTINYVPSIEFRTTAVGVPLSITPFIDIQRTAPKITPQKTAITKPAFQALSNYVDFINETWRQMEYMRLVLTNFNSSAAYYKTLPSFEKRGAMTFDFKDFQVPQSYYIKTISDSKVLGPDISKSLNDQSQVILSVLKEMNELGASLEAEVKSKKYEQDRLTNVYKILERQGELLKIWDERKETLYNDVRAVYNSYPEASQSSSWQVSGTALLELTQLNHDALFKAKELYLGDTTVKINTEKIEENLRNVIAREYENLNGIQKLGRSNGLCPYSPYEDIPKHSKTAIEYHQKLKPANGKTGYSHPYHNVVYVYNAIVDEFNRFAELSKTVPLLPVIKQPELFSVKYPEAKNENDAAQSQKSAPIVKSTSAQQQQQQNPARQSTGTKTQTSTQVVHDTVFIEKRDTVYLADKNEDLRSMEGYATNNLVLLLDVSGSMNNPDKLPVLKTSVLDMISMMRPEDKISIIVFSGKPRVLLQSVSFKDDARIKKAIQNLTSSGTTDGNAALKLAYKTADQSYIRGGNNRIVLATDGEFPVSDEVKKQIENFSSQDIFLSIFNFGKTPRGAEILGRLAKLGKGNYEAVSKENLQLKLIREAKAKKRK
jgi:Ca-activated chloride channel homolog